MVNKINEFSSYSIVSLSKKSEIISRDVRDDHRSPELTKVGRWFEILERQTKTKTTTSKRSHLCGMRFGVEKSETIVSRICPRGAPGGMTMMAAVRPASIR